MEHCSRHLNDFLAQVNCLSHNWAQDPSATICQSSLAISLMSDSVSGGQSVSYTWHGHGDFTISAHSCSPFLLHTLSLHCTVPIFAISHLHDSIHVVRPPRMPAFSLWETLLSLQALHKCHIGHSAWHEIITHG